MTLQELIAELAAATDGAAEDPGFRSTDEKFPDITSLRVTYRKRSERELEFSQIQVWVENIDTPEERAYYTKDRVPAPVKEALVVPSEVNASPEEIKARLDEIFSGMKYSDINIMSGAESGIVTGVFYDTDTGEAANRAYRVVQEAKGTFSLYVIKG